MSEASVSPNSPTPQQYRFEMLKGGSKPTRSLEAANDKEALQKADEIVKNEGGSYVPGSMTTSQAGVGHRQVLRPEEVRNLESTRSCYNV